MGCIINIEPPPGCIVRFISDLHLGHERCEAPPVAQLAPLLQGIGMLVVAGDMAETRKSGWRDKGLAAREELRSLCREHGVQLVEISGNHDPDTPALVAKFWGGRVVAMHGHALYKEAAAIPQRHGDELVSHDHRGIQRAAVCLDGVLSER